MPEHGRSLRPSASSPIPGPRPSSQPAPVQDPSVRVMRLKVLYTFDEDKTNCLARWPHPLNIRTAFLNPETQIGVIELKTCVQAIAAASPEIVAGLGQDYTVYAYDYSEYETPLVGQGMLSWALASASPTPGAPAERSLTMVTGRVSRNVMGLFSGGGGPQETLEVKLRLVPVPTSRQSEYLESMRKYRDVSQMIPPGFDAQVWTTFLHQNPGFMQQAMQQAMHSRSQSPTVNSNQAGHFGIEHVQRLLSGEAAQSNQIRQPLSRANSSTNVEAVQRLPRLPSPASSIASTAAAPKKRGRKPGPKPKTAKTLKKVEPALDSTDPGYGTGDDGLEEGSSRKRARVMQAEWDGKQDFGKQQDSLRVAASTAASVRIHQPTAVRPGQNAHLSLENQPRAPTPIADLSQKQSRPRLPVSKSNLGRHSMLSEVSSAESRRAASASDKAPEWSPEKSQAESSPLDIASSPPIFPGNSTTQSSPRLPEFPRTFEDSGFMNAAFDDLFDDEELRPLDDDDDDYAAAAQYSKRPDLPACSGGVHELAQDDSFRPNPQAQPSQQVPEGPQQHSSLGLESHNMKGPCTSVDPFPSINAHNSARPSGLTRSQTWSGNDPQHPASDGPPAQLSHQEHTSRPSSRGRARRQSDTGGHTGVKRRAAIQSRLANSMAAGEVPPFCDHCGAIETATWRKAWSKVHSGTPEHVHLSEDEGAILAWQTLQTDSSGVICLYRIIKKTLLKHDEGFTEMLLCNPCGMYLFTKKCMRPKDMWNRSQKGPDDKGKRKPNGRGRKSISDGPSSDAGASKGGPAEEPSSPSEAPKQNEAVEHEPQLPVLKRRSTSDAEARLPRTGPGLDEAATAAALERAIKSSPHKFAGTRKSPIEVPDLTPQPSRRVLFPSPSRSEGGQPMSKANSLADAAKGDVKMITPQASNDVTPSSSNKENKPPIAHDDIDRFFNEDGYAPNECHNSSSPSKSRLPCVIKTPTRSSTRRYPGESVSGSRSILRRTPKKSPMKGAGPLTELTPFTAHLNQLLSEANDMSPGMDRIDFAALPSLRNTPSASRFMDFDFGQFDSQDLISTDVPMPSSPPVWDSHTFAEAVGGGRENPWDEDGIPLTITSPAASQKSEKDGYDGECIGEADKEDSEQRGVIPV